MQTTTPPAAVKQRILCIDDDPILTDALARRLDDWGYEPIAANYGTHGISSALATPPHLIITDLRMPQGAGDYVIERLRHLPATAAIPIIVLTGCRDAELEMRLRGLGLAGFFTKPVACDSLRRAIDDALAPGPSPASPLPSPSCASN